jgi:hypothetical protein
VDPTPVGTEFSGATAAKIQNTTSLFQRHLLIVHGISILSQTAGLLGQIRSSTADSSFLVEDRQSINNGGLGSNSTETYSVRPDVESTGCHRRRWGVESLPTCCCSELTCKAATFSVFDLLFHLPGSQQRLTFSSICIWFWQCHIARHLTPKLIPAPIRGHNFILPQFNPVDF